MATPARQAGSSLEMMLRAKRQAERHAAYHQYAAEHRARATREALDQVAAVTRRLLRGADHVSVYGDGLAD